MDPSRTPVVVAAGQVTERSELTSAVEIAARASESALAAARGLRERIQRVTMVSVVFSPVGPRPASELAARLGLGEVVAETTTPGGNLPQWLVTRAAREIAEGRLDATLLAGGEATRSLRANDPEADFMRAARRGRWAQEECDPAVGPGLRDVLGPAELAIRLFQPTVVYPLLESVRAHRAGRGFAEQRTRLGPLMARFSEIAAGHEHAWLREALSADEIATASETNRIVAEPYTKQMNAFPLVDQGAAVVVTSLATARALGLADRCVFVWAGADAAEPTPVARPDLGGAAAMQLASTAAREAAGVSTEDLTHIDLYSCFPVAVEVGAEALGVATDDPRDLTVTGGLPFFGGPGNDYSMHAIATIAERLPAEGGLAYVGANGGMLSKHAIGIYGAEPPPRGFAVGDTSEGQARIDAAVLPWATEAEGPAEVVASTVVYARDGSVAEAPVVAALPDGRRIAARADASVLDVLAGRSLVGTPVHVSGSPPRYRPAE